MQPAGGRRPPSPQCTGGPDHTQPILRQGLEHRSQPVRPVRKCWIAGRIWKPFRHVVFSILADRLLRESPLADAPQGYCDTRLIRKLGTEMVALTLHYCLDHATIVAASVTEVYEICLTHTCIFCPVLTLDSHPYSRASLCGTVSSPASGIPPLSTLGDIFDGCYRLTEGFPKHRSSF